MKRIFGKDQGMERILHSSSGEEFDYGCAMDALRIYKNPRVKLNQLLKFGAIIRVKKGIYVIGPSFARRPFSHIILANMIYGPSYVSLEYALSYYNLIPEKVTLITSVTTNRSKEFQTPLAIFTYTHIPCAYFAIGQTLISISPNQGALIATKEKALADLLIYRRGSFHSYKHFCQTVFDDFRIEENEIKKLNRTFLEMYYTIYPHTALKYLLQVHGSL